MRHAICDGKELRNVKCDKSDDVAVRQVVERFDHIAVSGKEW